VRSNRLPVILRTPRGPRAERPRGPAANQGAFSHIDPSGLTKSGDAIHLPWCFTVQSLLFVGLAVAGGTIRQSVALDARVPDDARATAAAAIANTANLFTSGGYEGLQRFANRFVRPSSLVQLPLKPTSEAPPRTGEDRGRVKVEA